MMFLNWWTKILKTDFTRKELFFRITIDLFLSNLGLLLGILTTVGIWIFTYDVTPRAFFQEMFFKVWLANVPILTVCCFFAYTVSGLYKYKEIVECTLLEPGAGCKQSRGNGILFLSIVDLHHKTLDAPKHDDCRVDFYLSSDAYPAD